MVSRCAVTQQVKQAARPGHPAQHAHRDIGSVHGRLYTDALADDPANLPRNITLCRTPDSEFGDDSWELDASIWPALPPAQDNSRSPAADSLALRTASASDPAPK